MLVLVIYDMPDNRRRQKLSKLLEGYGRRVQKSGFECFIKLDELPKLYQQVQRQVKPAEDNVRFYWIAADALPKVRTIGSELPQAPPTFYIV